MYGTVGSNAGEAGAVPKDRGVQVIVAPPAPVQVGVVGEAVLRAAHVLLVSGWNISM